MKSTVSEKWSSLACDCWGCGKWNVWDLQHDCLHKVVSKLQSVTAFSKNKNSRGSTVEYIPCSWKSRRPAFTLLKNEAGLPPRWPSNCASCFHHRSRVPKHSEGLWLEHRICDTKQNRTFIEPKETNQVQQKVEQNLAFLRLTKANHRTYWVKNDIRL